MIYFLLDSIAWIIVIGIGIGIILTILGMALDTLSWLMEEEWFWAIVFALILLATGIVKI